MTVEGFGFGTNADQNAVVTARCRVFLFQKDCDEGGPNKRGNRCSPPKVGAAYSASKQKK